MQPVPLPAPQDDEELHWLALRLVSGLGTRKAGQLIGIFHTARAIFCAPPSELEAAGLAPAVAQSIASGCAFEEAASQHEKMKKAGAQLIPMGDPRYPPRLLDIFDPPPMLFVRGHIELLQTVLIGMVGTRRPTVYGTTVAARLAKDLASGAGLTIASGMARGIDTAAHRAVLDSGGNTVAVFGCGVDQVYPAENRKLSEQIAEQGLIVSEFPMGTPAYPQNFPVRNRIISGMSAGVVIVEGGEYSGSAITARLAMEQNRDVFAVPGNITSKMSWGPNMLIKQGAKLVQEWNDVVVELPAADRRWLSDRLRKQLTINDIPIDESRGPAAASLNPIGRTVLQALKPDLAVSLDQLIETVEGTSPSEVIATLFELELMGLVRQIPGKNFLRVWGS
jgi:DNA processing protein